MSHFRKITVNDTKYEYNIGKTSVFIRSKELKYAVNVEKSVIGFDYCGDVIVTPKMISNYILGNPKLKLEDCFPTCDCVGVEKSLSCIPFDADVYNKMYLVVWCEYCLDQNAGDI